MLHHLHEDDLSLGGAQLDKDEISDSGNGDVLKLKLGLRRTFVRAGKPET